MTLLYENPVLAPIDMLVYEKQYKKEATFSRKNSFVFGKSKTKSNPSMLSVFSKPNGTSKSSVKPFSPYTTMVDKENTSDKSFLRRTTTISANKKVKITNTFAEVSDRGS